MLDDQPVGTASVVSSGEGWIATMEIPCGVDLTLTSALPTDERVFLDLWKRPSGGEVGVAIVAEGGEPVGLAVIPVCGCGEQGCANAGPQLSESVDASGARDLIDLVSRLPLVGLLEPSQATWHLDGVRPLLRLPWQKRFRYAMTRRFHRGEWFNHAPRRR